MDAPPAVCVSTGLRQDILDAPPAVCVSTGLRQDMLDAPPAVCVSTGLTTDLGTEVHESWRLNCQRWRLIYFRPRYVTCFMSPFWRPVLFRQRCILVFHSCTTAATSTLQSMASLNNTTHSRRKKKNIVLS